MTALSNKPLPERLAARTITEAFRSLADPIDIGKALLALAGGEDPWKAIRKKAPDNLPNEAPSPIDWNHRLAALKLYLEYGYGKPQQGITIAAEINARTTVTAENDHVTELRELARSSPDVRELMRALAAKLANPEAIELEASDELSATNEPTK